MAEDRQRKNGKSGNRRPPKHQRINADPSEPSKEGYIATRATDSLTSRAVAAPIGPNLGMRIAFTAMFSTRVPIVTAKHGAVAVKCNGCVAEDRLERGQGNREEENSRRAWTQE